MLYIVATPIGNLQDLSYRAIAVLSQVDLIVAEDTRRSKILLEHYSINTKIISLHEHNETQIVAKLLELLQQGQKLALISDAGTPLISDPGYHLVKQCHLHQIAVSPVPGASATLAALSCSGLSTDQFIFIGFLPAKEQQRQQKLLELKYQSRTMVFFEAPHRILATIEDMLPVFNADRHVAFCRELTKQFETIKLDRLSTILEFIKSDPNQLKGEIVLVVSGFTQQNQPTNFQQIDSQTHNMLKILLEELPLSKAASVAAKITGIPKKLLYDYWLSLKS
jgi:16S rRNA (cytidine1402-2'-O)-methyltransferase